MNTCLATRIKTNQKVNSNKLKTESPVKTSKNSKKNG